MRNICRELNGVLLRAVKQAYPTYTPPMRPIVQPITRQTHFGDYMCSQSHSIAKSLKIPNTLEVSRKIYQNCEDNDIIGDYHLTENGMINLKIKDEILQKTLKQVLHGVQLEPIKEKKRVIVDFSSPNIAKEMHVGHLRSTIIGDCLSRIFEFYGHDVLRLNHVGDWGTQFGMLLEYLQDVPNWESMSMSELSKCYQMSKQKFDSDEDFKKRSLKRVVSIQNYDPDSIKMWSILVNKSRIEFQEIYDILDIQLEERGESFYQKYFPTVFEQLEPHIKISEGAKCIFIPNFKYPIILEKSDGGYTYDTTDVAALWHRLHVEKADIVLCVVDIGQRPHFDLVFSAGRLANWIKGHHRVEHVGFGLVCGEDGKKFKTRGGNVVRLKDLLDEAKKRAYEKLEEKDKERIERENIEPLTEEEKKIAAAVIGINAVKYADLKTNRNTNYIFSFDKMLSFKGNTAVYLLYAYARIGAILRKANTPINENASVSLKEEAERNLALHIARFPEILDQVAETLQPNILCEYLYALSNVVTTFYTKCRVVGSEEEEGRLVLCKATHNVMKKCFDLLGMKTLERV